MIWSSKCNLSGQGREDHGGDRSCDPLQSQLDSNCCKDKPHQTDQDLNSLVSKHLAYEIRTHIKQSNEDDNKKDDKQSSEECCFCRCITPKKNGCSNRSRTNIERDAKRDNNGRQNGFVLLKKHLLSGIRDNFVHGYGMCSAHH